MKYRMICLCLCFVLLLSGCQLVPDEYISVAAYTDSYDQPEEVEATTISNLQELKYALRSYVTGGAEEFVLIGDAYTGNIEADLNQAISYITQEHPECAYLVDDIHEEIAGTGSYFRLNLTIDYRHAPKDLEILMDVSSASSMEDTIKSALEKRSTKLLMRVSGFAPTDFEKMVNQCFENNLATIMAKPTKVVAAMYPDSPDSGNSRIVELMFTYPRDVAVLDEWKTKVDAIMASAKDYVNYGQSQMEKAMLLYSFLSERYAYEEGTSETPAYSLLYEGVADSQSFAAVYSAMCTNAGLRNTVVQGAKNGNAYSWNILELDSGTWHVDPFADELNGLREMQLLTDEQMYGYEWDWEAYPVCMGAPELPLPTDEEPAPAPEEVPPVTPDEPDVPIVSPDTPTDEDETPDTTQPPEENSEAGDISP